MNDEKLNKLLNKYNLTNDEKKKLLDVVYPIFKHHEFQKRMNDEFMHHSDITLGEHIIEVAIMTYLLAKKKKFKNINLDLALKIALFHDLYTIPWQNNKNSKVNHFCNKHGFRHPIESAINAINWFPDAFMVDIEKRIIIDGIIHHMYPLPVTVFKGEKSELKNLELLNCLNEYDKKIIAKSSNRRRFGNFSISRSLYTEGRIVRKADKKVSLNQIKNFSSALALITGKNRSLKK